MKTLALVLMMAATVAGQEMHWTPAEAAELRKLVDAGVRFARVQEDLGFLVPTLGKATVAPILEQVGYANNRVRVGMSMAFSSESNSSLTREQEVQQLRGSAQSLERNRTEIRAMLDVLPSDNPRVRTAKQDLDGMTIGTFDLALPFANPLPLSFPRIVGTHGDHEFGQGAMEHYVQYVYHCFWDGWNFWIRTDAPASSSARDFFRLNARAQALNYRAWGMTAEIVLPDDDAKIRADVAAGSGIRPYGFFRELLALEYLYGPGGPATNWHGRKIDTGARSFIRQFGDAFTRMEGELRLVNPTQFLLQWTGRRGAVSNTGPGGWAAEFHFDFSDFWNSLDAYAEAAMGFFHAIPSPPCGEGTRPENGVCVPL